MNIFVIDYICTSGHKFFNRIHIDALVRAGVSLSFISRRGYLEVSKSLPYYEIPEDYYLSQEINQLGSIRYNYYDIKKLKYAERIVERSKPDAVIVLTYDAISLAFFRVKCPTFVINHVNVDFLSFWYRNLTTKLFPKNYIHVCLSKRIHEYILSKLPRFQSVYIPHGILNTTRLDHNRDNVIFCPITSSVDVPLLNDIINNQSVVEYLLSKKIQFVIKTRLDIFKDTAPCFKLVKGYMDGDIYMKYVQNSIAIFLPYEKSFNFRVSGIFHEALSYNTPILTSDIPTFNEYRDLILYEFQIDSPEKLLNTLQVIEKKIEYYQNLGSLDPSPYWKETINKYLAK